MCNVRRPICKTRILKWYATDVCVIGLLPLYTCTIINMINIINVSPHKVTGVFEKKTCSNKL